MDELGPWEPLTPAEVVALVDPAGVTAPWWIAGGYAIELFLGRELRPHADIDVALLHRDQGVVHRVLDGWDIQAADPPGRLRPWRAGEVLPPAVHDVWCRERPGAPWRLQFMFEHADGPLWVSGRNPAVTLPVERLGWRTADGWPVLRPEVQLHYKARPAGLRAKDEVDFAAAAPHLDGAARRWLVDSLPAGHAWRAALSSS